ncbi:MAG: hypothetical protein K9M49_10005 [Candidatus Marinimicrobia bacterium]|nr:hypothetical protein [Candidatus Neomarinimicrobiota bacterium]MCF7850170.1 hypothetical protein [Candidatus Neomarinimicrobiota bacterium]MCF7905468.1 hypothetical protein [Candidatus Neomarinimicrobiota bacterium]
MSEEKKEKQEEQQEPQAEQQQEAKSDRTSKLMGDMMKGLREFGSSAMEKAEEFGKIATEKAEAYTKLGKIKLDIHQLKRSRTRALAELGELVMSLKTKPKLAKLGEHEDYLDLSKRIKELSAEISEKEALATIAEEEESKES